MGGSANDARESEGRGKVAVPMSMIKVSETVESKTVGVIEQASPDVVYVPSY